MSETVFKDLRTNYKTFTYKGWHLSHGDGCIDIVFDFEIEGLCEFHPSTKVMTDNLDIVNIYNSLTAQKIIFNLGMVELISYWKCACPPNINIECGYLSDEDKDWWKKLYFGGLSEFFYINDIATTEKDFMTINCEISEDAEAEVVEYNNTGINLIPVGGGKDSCVSAHLLKSFGDKNKFFTVNDQQARTDTVICSGYSEKDIIKTYRIIDKQLIDLNSKGFLNGHTPFSAIVAFLSLYCAYLVGGEYIVLSNESSANESNIEGTQVNHQYSKSFEFECDFMDYFERNIMPGIKYFSVLRPFSELQIAKMFAALPQYHENFRSCNRGSKQNIWCGKCAKCLFVFTIISPFMDYDRLVSIFGNNMLDDEDMKKDFEGLTGLTKLKPFECVGTKSEFNFALYTLMNKFKNDNRKLPLLVEYFEKNIDLSQIDKNLLKEYNPLNNVPEDFLFAIKEMYEFVADNN